jgi:hypothetical protein
MAWTGLGMLYFRYKPAQKEIPMMRKAAFSTVAAFVLFGALVLPATSADAATVSHATLNDGLLRVDGTNAARGVFVNVYSSWSSAGARSDSSSGVYHIQKANFRADDCRVVVSDGRTPIATVRLSGCTPQP